MKLNKLIINNSTEVIGDLTVSKILDNNKLTIQGIISMHDYIEEIFSIKSDRYEIQGINVFEEDYSSSDIRILYKFFAREIKVINGQKLYSQEELSSLEEQRWSDLNGWRK